MADTYLYLSLIPEALVASMLPPEEFGTYLAVGTMKRSRGDAMYFSLRPDFRSEFFDFSRVARSCVPHADGSPKHSFVGDPGGVVYYPFPSPAELARHHHKWHRSAML